MVRIGTAATNFALKANLPVEGLIRSTVFDHFCGGVSEEDCLPVIDKMYAKGVTCVLDYSVEGKESEDQFDAALNKTLEIINFAHENNYQRIQILSKEDLSILDSLEFKISFNLMRKSLS